MTKSRKISLALVVALIFALLATCVIPLANVGNSNVADAVTVTPRDEWSNPYSGSYYNNLNTDKVGLDFRADLADLITKTHTHLTTYNESRDWFATTDADPNKPGNIIWFYTGTSVAFNGSLGSSSGTTNREHVWAKNGGDTFPPQSGPGADAHHLRPTESLLNNKRSNFGFGEVPQTGGNIAAQAGKTDYGNAPDGLCYLGTVNGATLFYPAAGYRGATARILMYMQVRWGDENNLYFLDGASTSNGKGIGKISDLFKWHLLEPPTDEEIRRNNVVAGYQGNRNPFIDHPEYAEMIYCNDGQSYNNALKNAVAQYGSYLNSNVDPDKIPTSISLSQSSLTLTVGQQSQQITVTAQPAKASTEVTWSTSNSSVATVSNGVVTAKAQGTATITATSKYDEKVKATLSVNVNPVQLTGLTISQSSLTLKDGRTTTLTVTPTPSNASAEVNWSSDDEAVATVSKTGHVTAVGVGTAHITATSVYFPNISVTATVTVVAAPKPTQIEVLGTPNKKEYVQGETFDPTGLTVKISYSDGTSESITDIADLLENFEWLDGETGATTLTKGTTTVICKYGAFEATVSGITVNSNIEDFLNKMAAIEADSFENLSLDEQFNALKEAVAAYNRLTATEKNNSQVVGKYATLRNAISDYNTAANTENAEFQQAATLSASVIARAISTTIAALIAIVKGLLRR